MKKHISVLLQERWKMAWLVFISFVYLLCLQSQTDVTACEGNFSAPNSVSVPPVVNFHNKILAVTEDTCVPLILVDCFISDRPYLLLKFYIPGIIIETFENCKTNLTKFKNRFWILMFVVCSFEKIKKKGMKKLNW